MNRKLTAVVLAAGAMLCVAAAEPPEEYAVKSNLKIGQVYCGCLWSGDGYSEHEIWEGDMVSVESPFPGESGREYALIPVTGSGTINPVVFYGDTPTRNIVSVEVWTDSQLRDAFTPSGVSPSWWEDDGTEWEYENGIHWYSWAKSAWPENKVVADRRWILVGIGLNPEDWAGVTSFRVGISGTSEVSAPFSVRPTEAALSLPVSGFVHGIAVSGVELFSPFDNVRQWWTYDEFSGGETVCAQTYEFDNYSAMKGRAMSFSVDVPSAGTLVVSSEDDDDDSPALQSAFSVSGWNIVSDRFVERSTDWEAADFAWTDENFWKTTCARWIRRIEVSAGTTLTFTRRNADDTDCEFNRMYFFPKDARSVAVEVGYASCEHPGDNFWWDGYLQGYVTGSGVYRSGETATLRAVAGNGEAFDHWEVRYGNLALTEEQKTSPTLSFRVTDAMCGGMADEEQIFISAVWKPKYRITALPAVVGTGTVTGTGRYHEGDVVTLTAKAASGYKFEMWSDGETDATRRIEVTEEDADQVIYACFDAPFGTISASAEPVGAGGVMRMTFRRTGGSEGKVAVKVKTQTSTGVCGTDFAYVKTVLVWEDGDDSDKVLEIPTYATGAGKTLRVKLATLTTGAYEGCVAPMLAESKVYAEMTDPNPGTIAVTAPTPLSVEGGEVLRMTFSRVGGSDGKIAVKAKTQASTALMGTNGSADFDYVKAVLEWGDGDATDRYLDIPTYIQPWEGTRALRVKLATLATGAYAGNLVPKLAESKIYADIVNPSRFGTVSVAPSVAQPAAGEPLTLVFRRTGGSDWPVAVKYKVQTSTAVAGADFEYTKGVVTWDDGDDDDIAVEVPTYPSAAGKQLRVKLSTLTQGAYEGCVTPHLRESKVYVSLYGCGECVDR